MAFDLNKNDGSVPESSGKPAAKSKFDLSKGEEAGTEATTQAPKSKTWIIGLVGILIVGTGIWYYSSHPKRANTNESASTAVAAHDSSRIVTDTSKRNTQTEPVKPTATETAIVATKAPAATNTASHSDDVAKTSLTHKIPVTFKQGSSAFRTVDESMVKKVISYLAKNPAASIHVDGYASSDGSLEINQTISQARADGFKKYLVSKDVAENRVVAIGKGIQNPIASNDTNAGRKKNRRVEITLP